MFCFSFHFSKRTCSFPAGRVRTSCKHGQFGSRVAKHRCCLLSFVTLLRSPINGTKLDPGLYMDRRPKKTLHKHLWVSLWAKSCTHGEKKARKQQLRKKMKKKMHLTTQWSFPTMGLWVWKIRKYNDAHNGLTNCSFVFENASPFERFCQRSHTVTDYV